MATVVRYCFVFLCLTGILVTGFCQNEASWASFTASDGIRDAVSYQGDLWVAYPGGLTQISPDQTYTYHTSVNTSIPVHQVRQLIPSEDHGLWAITSGNGILHLQNGDWTAYETTSDGVSILECSQASNIVNGTFYVRIGGSSLSTQLAYWDGAEWTAVNHPDQLVGSNQGAFVLDQEEVLWANVIDTTNQRQLWSYDGTEWSFPTDLGNLTNDSRNHYHGFLSDDNDLIFVSYHESWSDSTYLTQRNALGEWQRSSAPIGVNDISNNRRPIITSPDGKLWFSASKQERFWQYDNGDWSSIPFSQFNLPTGNIYNNLRMQSYHLGDDSSWFVLHRGAITKMYRFQNGTLQVEPTGNAALHTNIISVNLDAAQRKWISGSRGIQTFDGTDWANMNLGLNRSTQGIVHSPSSSYIYHGSGGGSDGYEPSLYRFDGVAAIPAHIPDHFNGGLYNSGIRDVTVASNGDIFACNGNIQLFHFDGASWATTPTEIDPLENLIRRKAVESSPDGSIYILGERFLGEAPVLEQLNEAGTTIYELPTTGLSLLNDLNEHSLYVDQLGQVWLIYPEGQIYQFENGIATLFHTFPGYETNSQQIISPFLNVYTDQEGAFWAYGVDGLHHLLPDGNWERFTVENSGLQSNNVSSMHQDVFGNYWIGTNSGLSVYNPDGIVNIGVLPETVVESQLYWDQNQNGGHDTTDAPMVYQSLSVVSTDQTQIIFGNALGQARFSKTAVDSTEYTLQANPIENWVLSSTPDSYTLPVDAGNYEGYDFGYTPTETIEAFSITLSSGFPRCNREVNYWLHYTNQGTTEGNAVLWLKAPEAVQLISTENTPDWTSGDTLFWNFNDLLPFEQRLEKMVFLLPPFDPGNNSIYWETGIYNDESELLSSHAFWQTIFCAYDPNDKTAIPTGASSGDSTLLMDELDYLIRFQNTGNDTAFRVVIRDTIMPVFEAESLEILASSHPMRAVLNGSVVDFIFDPIILPDSTANEPESHGFVRYRISPRADLPEGTVATNRAAIYFDFNAPIITNTTQNTLVSQLVATRDLLPGIRLQAYPNPCIDGIWLELDMPFDSGLSPRVQVLDVHGRIIQQQALLRSDTRHWIEMKGLPAGSYIIKIQVGDQWGRVLVTKH